MPPDVPHVYVAGAFAHGKAEADFAEECIAVSQYPLSGAAAVGAAAAPTAAVSERPSCGLSGESEGLSCVSASSSASCANNSRRCRSSR